MAFFVGAVPVSTLSGQLEGARQDSRILQARGLTGHDQQNSGLAGGRFQVEVTFYALINFHPGWIANLEAMQGTIQNITNPLDEAVTFPAFIQRVEIVEQTSRPTTSSSSARTAVKIEGVRQ